MRKRRAMTSEDASQKKIAGHEREAVFADLIDGDVIEGQVKRDVTDKSGRTYSVKGATWWQIFLYSRHRIETNTVLQDIGNLANRVLACMDAFPPTFAGYQANKTAAKTGLQVPMQELREELEKPEVYAAFIKAAFFNDDEVDYLAIFSDKKFHIFESAIVVETCNDFSVANSQARKAGEMDNQKVLLKFPMNRNRPVNIGEIEMRNESIKHYKQIKFRINGPKFLEILQNKVGDDFEKRCGMIVYGNAQKTLKPN